MLDGPNIEISHKKKRKGNVIFDKRDKISSVFLIILIFNLFFCTHRDVRLKIELYFCK